MKLPSNTELLEELLISDTSSLAICIYIQNNGPKVDLEDLQKSFGNAELINKKIDALTEVGALETGFTGKRKGARLFLSKDAENILSNISEAADDLRKKQIRHTNHASMEGSIGMFHITYITEENDDGPRVDSSFITHRIACEVMTSPNEDLPMSALKLDVDLPASQGKRNSIGPSTTTQAAELSYTLKDSSSQRNGNPWQN